MKSFQTVPENRTTNSLSIDCNFLNHGEINQKWSTQRELTFYYKM